MKEYVNLREYQPNDRSGNDYGQSMTVPNQTISIRELYDRQIKGRPKPAL